MKKSLLACGLLLASCGTPNAAYIQADRDTLDAIAPEFVIYVMADPLLDQQQKDRRLLTVELWRQRVQAAEGVAK